MATNNKPHETDAEAGATITRGEFKWGSLTLGTAADDISFGFRTSAIPLNEIQYSQPTGDNVPGTFSAFSTAEQTAARTALALWASVANITFDDEGSTNDASILFSNYKSTRDGSEAFTFIPGDDGFGTRQSADPASNALDGDSFYNTAYMSTTNDAPGTYAFGTFIHEIGHAIGLEHPGDYNAAPGVTITYANSADYYEDSLQYTIMSYFSETNTGANFKGVDPQTPMIDDIEAIQNLYGANLSTRTGDTTYGFHATADTYANSDPSVSSALQHIYDFSLNKTPVFCIYDAGGNNTLDCSGYAGAQTINLNNGSFSSVMGLVDNISISDATSNGVFITHVQNAIGGKGNDTIISGAAGDHMTGGAGSNVFEGIAAALNDDFITDFTLTDKLDITDLAYGSGVTASFADNVLSLSTGSTSVALTIDTALKTPFGFSFRSDGHGGTLASFTTLAPTLAKGLDTGTSTTDGVTKDDVLTFTGTVTANADVTLFDGDTEVGTATANTKGAYTVTSSTLGDGTHTLYVVATDATQDTTIISAGRQIIVDTTAPTTPTAALDAGSDSGVSSSDDITKVTRPVIIGTADAGTTIALYDGSKKIGSAVATSGNTYSITSATLAVGLHHLTVVSTDLAGNTATSALLDVTIDTRAGAVSIANKSAAVASAAQTISGKGEAGSSISLTDNGTALGDSVTVAADGTWSADVTLATLGRNLIVATEVDLAGNKATSKGVILTTTSTAQRSAAAQFAATLFDGFFGHSGSATSMFAAPSMNPTHPSVTASSANVFDVFPTTRA